MTRVVEIEFDDLKELAENCYHYTPESGSFPVCGCCGVEVEFIEHKEDCPVGIAFDLLYMEGSIY